MKIAIALLFLTHLSPSEEVLKKSSKNIVLVPTGWKGKGVLVMTPYFSSLPSADQPSIDSNLK